MADLPENQQPEAESGSVSFNLGEAPQSSQPEVSPASESVETTETPEVVVPQTQEINESPSPEATDVPQVADMDISNLEVATTGASTAETKTSGSMSKRMWMIVLGVIGVLAILVAIVILILGRTNLFQGALLVQQDTDTRFDIKFDAENPAFVEFKNANEKYKVSWSLNFPTETNVDVEIYATEKDKTERLCKLYDTKETNNPVPGNFSGEFELQARDPETCNLPNGDYELVMDVAQIADSKQITANEEGCEFEAEIAAIEKIVEIIGSDGENVVLDELNQMIDDAYASEGEEHFITEYSNDAILDLLAKLREKLDRFAKNGVNCEVGNIKDPLDRLVVELAPQEEPNTTEPTDELAPTAELLVPLDKEIQVVNPDGVRAFQPVDVTINQLAANDDEDPVLSARNYSANAMETSDYSESFTLEPYVMRGNATDDGEIVSITINGESVEFESDGSFCTELPLVAGRNNFEIIAEDDAGNTVSLTAGIDHKPSGQKNLDSCGQDLAGLFNFLSPDDLKANLLQSSDQVVFQKVSPAAVNEINAAKELATGLKITGSTTQMLTKKIEFKVNIPEAGPSKTPGITPTLELDKEIYKEEGNTGLTEALVLTVLNDKFNLDRSQLKLSSNADEIGLEIDKVIATGSGGNQLRLVLSAKDHDQENNLDKLKIKVQKDALTEYEGDLESPSFAVEFNNEPKDGALKKPEASLIIDPSLLKESQDDDGKLPQAILELVGAEFIPELKPEFFTIDPDGDADESSLADLKLVKEVKYENPEKVTLTLTAGEHKKELSVKDLAIIVSPDALKGTDKEVRSNDFAIEFIDKVLTTTVTTDTKDATPSLVLDPELIKELEANNGQMEELKLELKDGKLIDGVKAEHLSLSSPTSLDAIGLDFTLKQTDNTILVLSYTAANHTSDLDAEGIQVILEAEAIDGYDQEIKTENTFAIEFLDPVDVSKPVADLELDKDTITDKEDPAFANYTVDVDDVDAKEAVIDLYLLASDQTASFYLESDKPVELTDGKFETDSDSEDERQIFGTVDNTLTGDNLDDGTYTMRLVVKEIDGVEVDDLSDDASLTIDFVNQAAENDQATAEIDNEDVVVVNEEDPVEFEEDDTPIPVVSPTAPTPVITTTEVVQFDDFVSVQDPIDRQVRPSAPDAQASVLSSPIVGGQTGPAMAIYPFLAAGSYLLARRRRRK